MLKNVAILLIVCLNFANECTAQYTDDAPEKKDSTGNTNGKPMFDKLKDNSLLGLEFMFNGGNGGIYAELSPFVGVKVAKPILLGAGMHGSFLTGNTTRGYYGGHAFARLIIAQQFFLHAEYRLLNGVVPSSNLQRKTVASPIYGIGFMNGGTSWFMIGYAQNPEFQASNPFGALVYRIGLYF